LHGHMCGGDLLVFQRFVLFTLRGGHLRLCHRVDVVPELRRRHGLLRGLDGVR
jgi:hypothetical protein